MLGVQCEIDKVSSSLDVGLERRKEQIEIEAPGIVDNDCHRVSDLNLWFSIANTAACAFHTCSYDSGEKPQLSRDASASICTSFPELNKLTERPLSTNAELWRSSIKVDEDGLLSAYTLSTVGFSKSWERRNDPRPPVDPVSNTTSPLGCEAAPLTTGK